MFRHHRYQEVYRTAGTTTTGQRWPWFAPKARELDIGSMPGFLLFTEHDELGALDLYSSQPGAFTGDCEQVGCCRPRMPRWPWPAPAPEGAAA